MFDVETYWNRVQLEMYSYLLDGPHEVVEVVVVVSDLCRFRAPFLSFLQEDSEF